MNFGRVVGRLIATRRAVGFSEPRLVLLQPIDEHLADRGSAIVAVDPLQNAGLEDLVYYVSGSDAASAVVPSFQPIDAAIVGLVDGYSDFGPERDSASCGHVGPENTASTVEGGAD